MEAAISERGGNVGSSGGDVGFLDVAAAPAPAPAGGIGIVIGSSSGILRDFTSPSMTHFAVKQLQPDSHGSVTASTSARAR